ncbi:hypothetical protein ABIA33_007628 [Streptacidiphilus sp. MAP12-16]
MRTTGIAVLEVSRPGHLAYGGRLRSATIATVVVSLLYSG